MNKKWVKLKRFNDWGKIYLALPGKGLSEYGTSSESDYGLPFIAGMEMHVRWPNGKEQVATIVMSEHRSSVSDMGRSYPVTYELPGVIRTIDGIDKWFALDLLEVLCEELPKPKKEET